MMTFGLPFKTMYSMVSASSISHFIYLSFVLAVLACGVNIWSFFKSRPNHDLPVMMMALSRGLLAGCYAIAYVWLIAHPHQQLEWSQFLTGIGWVTWIVVWNAPALVLAHTQTSATRRGQEIQSIADNITSGK